MNIFHKYTFFLYLLCCLVSLVACDNDEPKFSEKGPANRTVLVYMMAENSLSDYAEKGYGNIESDIDEMLLGASSIPDNDHLIVFLDDANSLRNPRIYEIKKPSGKEKESQVELIKEYAEDVCSTDPAVLNEVLNYVRQNYPSKGYGLIMWSHGSGWLPADEGHTKDSRSIGIDNERNTTSNSGIEMNISMLAEVLADFGKLDFLYFDACFMQGIEVAYELKDVTDYMIGCPAETPGTGARYDWIIPAMFTTVADVKGIVQGNYDYYDLLYNNYKNGGADSNDNYGCLMSVIKCDELDNLAAITAPIIVREASEKHLLPIGNEIQTYSGGFTTSSYPEFYDLCGVVYSLSDTEEEYDNWLKQFDKTVIYRVCTDEWYGYGARWNRVETDPLVSPYGGVSMYVPKNGVSYLDWNKAFQETCWYKAVWNDTGW